MAYETKHLRRQKVRYDDENDENLLVYQLVLDGEKVTPTSATITIYAPGSTTALVSADDMTVSGTLLTYAVDTTTEASWPISQGYRADIIVTYSATTYPRHVMFDVCQYPFELTFGRDQLVAIDDQVANMDWNGDADLSELINAANDHIWNLIESRVLAGGRLLTEMILDHHRMNQPGCYWALAQLFAAKSNEEKRDWYNSLYESQIDAALNSIQYDQSQDGAEDAQMGGIQSIRLYT